MAEETGESATLLILLEVLATLDTIDYDVLLDHLEGLGIWVLICTSSPFYQMCENVLVQFNAKAADLYSSPAWTRYTST